MQVLWKSALAPGTFCLYQTAYQLFKRFLEQYSLWNSECLIPPIVDEDILLYFVTYCVNLGLRYNTIKQYLAGIRHHYTAYNVSIPLSHPASLSRLHTLLRGVKKSQCNLNTKRLPITYQILLKILTAFKDGFIGTYNGGMLSAACSMAFFGFLRCGEFTVSRSQFSPAHSLCIQDIVFHENYSKYVLHLKSSKADVFRCGVHIPIFASFHSFCPVHLMREYIDLRLNSGASSSDPLFITSDGVTLSRDYFISCVKSVLHYLGFNEDLYNGHSFRIGSASSAAKAKIPDHLIKTLGRWSSDCYTRYIHTDPEALRNAQFLMQQ